eukprot:GHRQ01025470.1.p1 GENE.GHRQ01025470.1~~GHRQ01025470.1.p1  ORF type:complete len:160 (+),score=14.33 GHRQ01025470.1:200-679(+)
MADLDATEVTFVIKNPSKHDSESFRLSVPAGASVADIQDLIHKQYDGKPSPSTQTVSLRQQGQRLAHPLHHGHVADHVLSLQLIYAGKVLKDTSLLVKDLVKVRDDAAHLEGVPLLLHCRSSPSCPLAGASRAINKSLSTSTPRVGLKLLLPVAACVML